MRLPHHLYKHPMGAFYFVCAIPKPLQAAFGKRRLRYSLKTKEPAVAKLEAYKHTTIWLERFAEMSEPKVKDILNNSNLQQMIVPTKSGFISQAKTREERELDLEEIGRLGSEGIKPKDLMEAQASQAVVASASHLIPKSRITMQEATKRFFASLPKNTLPKTLEAKENAVFEFKKFIKASKSLYTISREDLANFKIHLLEKNELRTVNNKFVYLTQFFDEMIGTGLYKYENPARGVVKYTKKQKTRDTEDNKHLPFDEHELQAIFNPETYPKHKAHLFWGIMLAYYTGMRVNEVAQLLIVNIDMKANLINVSSSGKGQSVKSVNARRPIPIHKDIIAAGFYDYINDLREQKHFRLFPKLNNTKNRYGGRLSSDFSRHLVKIGIKQERKSFHSLRETLAEMLDTAEVDIVSSSYFIGHAIDSVFFKHYLLKNPKITSPESLRKLCLPAITSRAKGIKYQSKMFSGEEDNGP